MIYRNRKFNRKCTLPARMAPSDNGALAFTPTPTARTINLFHSAQSTVHTRFDVFLIDFAGGFELVALLPFVPVVADGPK